MDLHPEPRYFSFANYLEIQHRREPLGFLKVILLLFAFIGRAVEDSKEKVKGHRLELNTDHFDKDSALLRGV